MLLPTPVLPRDAPAIPFECPVPSLKSDSVLDPGDAVGVRKGWASQEYVSLAFASLDGPQSVDDELKDLKEVTNKIKEDDQKDDEANRKVKRGREEEFAMQIGLLRRVTSRSCMRNTSAPCVAFGADRALVKLAER